MSNGPAKPPARRLWLLAICGLSPSVQLWAQSSAIVAPHTTEITAKARKSSIQMQSTNATVAQRFQVLKGLVRGCDNVIYDTSVPRRPDRAGVDAFLDEAASGGEAVKAMVQRLKGSMLRGPKDGGGFLYAVVPAVAAHRAPAAGAVTFGVASAVTVKQFLTQAAVEERYNEILPGVLTIDAHAGANVADIKVGDKTVVIRPVPPESGTVTHLSIDVGGVGDDGADSVPIEDAVTRLGLEWCPLGGRPPSAMVHGWVQPATFR